MTRESIVIDNNALISRLLLPKSVPGLAVRRVVETGQLLVSEPTLNEIADVLSRPKFDSYVSIEDRQQFLRLLTRVAEIFDETGTVLARSRGVFIIIDPQKVFLRRAKK